jgi:pimeloyl-ACP methyl ester carboxylesterase
MADSNPNGKFVHARDLAMYYEEVGTGQPLILIHGAFGSSADWAASAPAFAPHFRVIMPDSRGHGRTANPRGELSYRMMADDMAAFISGLGLEKPLVAGWSDGGQIALEMGIRYPDLVSAYIVGGAFYKLTEQYQEAIIGLGIEGSGRINVEALKVAFGNWNAELEAQALQLSVPFWAEPNYSSAEFARITAPTLVLLGDRDEAIPVEQAVEMYRQIPQAELAIVPGADHSFSAVGMEAFNHAALEFLLRHRA